MVETIILAMLLAKIKGYKLKALLKSWELYPILGFVILYLILNLGVFLGDYRLIKYSGVFEKLYICSFFPVIIRYRQYSSAIIGSISILIGTVLNKIVIFYNNGKMPVFPKLSYLTGYVTRDTFLNSNDIHTLGNSMTKLKALADIFDLGYSILSIGDIFIRLFTFVVVYNTVRYANNLVEREL